MIVRHRLGATVIHLIAYLSLDVSRGYVNLHSTTSQFALLVHRIPTFQCVLTMSNCRYASIDGSCSWLT
jgi:hypothetical protein